MASRKENTSAGVASKASQQLRDGRTNAATKSVAGSALSQRSPNRATSVPVAEKAGEKLQSDRTGKAGKTVAGSVLTQAPNRKK